MSSKATYVNVGERGSSYWQVLNKLMPLDDDRAHKDRTERKVYFLHAPELRRIKIGYSANPHVRSLNLRSLHRLPHEITLTVIGTLDGGPLLEELMHERYAEHRVSGEWFDDAILSDVQQLLDAERAWFGCAA